ncbi:MAG: EAL domain-containing protein [Ruminococcus sp.]|nr:EAL domain-containing protein [Ruminococcus sp.]
MERRMSEQELLGSFENALKFGHIYVCYQPKMNHATGRMIGAEALMRWHDPVYGMQYPSDFIPLLERNDLICQADLFVFETVCKFQRKCLDTGVSAVPVSINMSRYDIYQKNYVDEIEHIRQKYDVPVKLLHVEITESSAIGGMELVSGVLSKLHDFGYVVEMDDFGSGYSSLNVLKDLQVDVIKLDMRFLSGNVGGRGGTIISAIVQMTKWLNTPVVAEGVETIEQADYMKSIGCNYIQGYLYSKPVNEDEFIEKLKKTDHEPVAQAIDLISTMDAGKFWNPQSLETLIFNNYVGGASIFTYQKGKIEILRVNKKFIKETGMNMTEKEVLTLDPWDCFDEKNRKIYEEALLHAIETNDEVSCETCRTLCSKICGEEELWMRSDIRMIGKAGDQYIFYSMVHNITNEKKRFEEVAESDRKLRFASEHANVYAWEYTIATKEMRPCFRCMRDLGVPPVVENYPEPLIENGLFPPDYADMYREWIHKLENGDDSMKEAIIPLTVGRIPFYVRYSLEYDENGKPLKAYGSATLVIENNDK